MKGYFHWILGQKITQLSDITGYLQELLHLQEKAFALATFHYRIVYFHYCTYNAFKKVDFHVLIENVDSTNLNFKQQAKFYIVEKDGKKFVKNYSKKRLPCFLIIYHFNTSRTEAELNEEFWSEIYLSNVLRAQQRPLPHVKPLKLKECLDSVTEEQFFLKVVDKIFWQGSKQLKINFNSFIVSDY
jgi:hypothetical protein